MGARKCHMSERLALKGDVRMSVCVCAQVCGFWVKLRPYFNQNFVESRNNSTCASETWNGKWPPNNWKRRFIYKEGYYYFFYAPLQTTWRPYLDALVSHSSQTLQNALMETREARWGCKSNTCPFLRPLIDASDGVKWKQSTSFTPRCVTAVRSERRAALSRVLTLLLLRTA